jgi:hypothetical protein
MAGIIRKCYGCGQAFSERYRNAPNDTLHLLAHAMKNI